MLALILPVVDHLFGGAFTAWLNYRSSKDGNILAGFQNAAGGDRDIALARFQAEIQLATLKAASNTWWGARLIILLAGLPCALHLAAIAIDSTFLFGWRVAKMPAPYDGYEWAIVQSFFLVNVSQHVTSTLSSAWLSRK